MFLLPSLRRPNSLRRFLNAYIATSASEHVVVWVEETDPYLVEYESLQYPRNVTLVVSQPGFVGECLNRAFKKYSDEPFYGFLSDDCIPKTKNWDTLLAKSAGNWNVAYPHDMSDSNKTFYDAASHDITKDEKKGKQLATFPCVGGELVRALGGWNPAGIQHFWTDTFWHRVGVELNTLVFRDDVIFEHCHPNFGKGEKDYTWKQVRGGNKTYNASADKQRFYKWFETNRDLLSEVSDKIHK